MTPDERAEALLPIGRVLLAAAERYAARLAREAAAAERGAQGLPADAPTVTDEELRRRPRYRPGRRRPPPAP